MALHPGRVEIGLPIPRFCFILLVSSFSLSFSSFSSPAFLLFSTSVKGMLWLMLQAPLEGAPVTYCEMGAQFSGSFPIFRFISRS